MDKEPHALRSEESEIIVGGEIVVCDHRDHTVYARLDEPTMTLYDVYVRCHDCGATADPLRPEVVLGPWKPHD